MSARRALPAVLLGAMLLAACGGPGVPEGWRQVEQGWLSVNVPEGWVEVPDAAVGPYDLVLQDSADDPTVQLVAATEYTTSPAWAVLGNVRDEQPFGPLDDAGTISPVERGDDLFVERWDFTYEDGEFEGVMWAAGDDDAGRSVALGVTGSDLSEETVQRIQESIQVLSEEAAPAEDATA